MLPLSRQRRKHPARVMAQIAGMLVCLTVGGTFCRAAQANGNISGVVRNNSGQPVPNAFVRLSGLDRPFVFMVTTEGRGAFHISGLPPGRYRVQAVGGGYQSELSEALRVGNGPPANASLVLNIP